MDNIISYIKPELLILIPVAYFIGHSIKQTETIKDKYIPAILGIVCMILSVIYTLATSSISTTQDIFMAIFVSITQGILTAGCSGYINQLIKQSKKEE